MIEIMTDDCDGVSRIRYHCYTLGDTAYHYDVDVTRRCRAALGDDWQRHAHQLIQHAVLSPIPMRYSESRYSTPRGLRVIVHVDTQDHTATLSVPGELGTMDDDPGALTLYDATQATTTHE